MPFMNGPIDGATLPPDPGERPPADRPVGRLARPPSERYGGTTAAGESNAAGPVSGSPGAGQAIVALRPAIGALIVTIAALVVVGGVLAEQRGLLAIAGIAGAAIGLLAAGAAVSPDGVAPPALARGRMVRAAVALALLAIAGGAAGTWAYGRLEGGVLDPLTYLWSVFGPLIPAEAAIAALAAAWGAGAGPVRSRS
jgi:hypothetical protein